MAAKSKIENYLQIKDSEDHLFLSKKSNAIAGVAYDPNTKILYVLFIKKGQIPTNRYVYLNVPLKLFLELATSTSLGVAIVKKVVNGGFQFYDEPNK